MNFFNKLPKLTRSQRHSEQLNAHKLIDPRIFFRPRSIQQVATKKVSHKKLDRNRIKIARHRFSFELCNRSIKSRGEKEL